MHLGHGRFAGDAALLHVARPGGPVCQQRAGFDPGRHVGQLRLRDLEVAQRMAEHFALPRAGQGFVERAAREAERRSGHRGAKDIEVAHRELEAFAFISE